MSEVASLVVAVDSTSADSAVRSLRDLAQQGAATEAAVKKTGDSGHALKSVSREADIAARAMGSLSTAAKGLVATMSIGEVIRLSDAYTKYTAQLKLATDSVEGFAKAQNDVRRIAKTAQADLEGTAMLYARIANGTRELGLSQERIAKVTESVSLALRVSGATAAESSSAMLQLSQAFASGALRGEEFNSVNEAAPRLMRALADGMGVAVGALRDMAAEGKITSEIMANALPAALQDLRKEAAQIQTIGGAFTNLKNELLELVGTQSQASGFVSALTGSLNLLADNLQLVTSLAGALAAARIASALGDWAKRAYDVAAATQAQAAAQTRLAAATSAAAVGTKALGTAYAALGGPIGLATLAVIGGYAAWNSYRDSVDSARGSMVDLQGPLDEIIAKFERLTQLERTRAIDLKQGDLDKAVRDAATAVSDLVDAFEPSLAKGAKAAARFRAEFKSEVNGIAQDLSLTREEVSNEINALLDRWAESSNWTEKQRAVMRALAVSLVDAAGKVRDTAEQLDGMRDAAQGAAKETNNLALAAARLRAGLDSKEWDTFISKAQAAATTVGMSAQQLGEFQAKAMGASDAQAQLAGVLHGMADAARSLEKATADKDSKAQAGAKTLIAALAQQEVQLRVNIRAAQEYARLMAMGVGQTDASRFSAGIAESARAEYEREVTERLKALFANIANNTEISKSATSAAEKATKAINDQIKALQLQAATVGMAEDQVTLYKLATEGATKAQLASAKAALDARRAGELSLAVAKRRIDTSNDAIKAAAEEAQRNIDLAETFGLSAAGIEQLTVARLEHELARAEAAGADADEIERLKILIALRQESMGALITLEQKERQKQQWEEWARDVEQIFNRVGQSLTDAIFDGGKSGRDLLRDLFKGLTFNILINPVMNQMQGWVTNQLGGLFGVQNPAQGGGILGTAQNLYSGYNAITGGLNSTLGNAAQWLGQKVGSEALTSFGLGLSGTTAATGIASIGAGLGASLGTTIGTSAATMASTSFAASMTGGAIIPGLGVGAAGGGVGAGIGAAAGSAAAGGAAAGGAAGIGSAVGAALPWIGGALAIGSAFGLFGDDEPRTRHAQMSHADLQTDGRFAVTTWDDRQSRESQIAAAAYATEAVKGATELFSKIGIDAEFKRFTTLMESSILGDKQGVGSSGTIRIGDLEHEIGLAIESSWTKHGVGGWSEAEMLPRLMTDVQLTILEAFQAAGDQLPSVLSGMLEGVDIRSLGAEQAQALAQSFQTVVDQVSILQGALEQLPFANLRDLSFDAAAGLIAAAGGLENLNAGMTSYFQTYYSEAEQLDHLSKQLSASFAGIGMEMPDVTQGAEAAKHAFRALFESIDPTTEEGQQAAAVMLSINQSFAQLVTGLEELEGAAADATNALRERESLERQLLQLQGNTAELRRRELEALDESNRALQQQIWAYQDLSTAYNEVVAAGQREIARLQESFGATDNALSAYRSAVQRLESEFNSLFSAIDRGVQALRGTGAAFDAQYHQARAVISTTLLTGQLPQTADLSEAIRVAQQGVMGQRFASREDQQRAYLTLANQIEGIKAIAEPELDTAKATLSQLEAQYRLLRGMSLVGEDSLTALEQQLRTAMSAEEAARRQITAIEEEIDIAREQYNVLLEIRDGILSFPDALAQFAKAVSAPALSGGGGGGGGSYPSNSTAPGSPYSRAVAYYTANPDVASAFNRGDSGSMSFDEFARYHYETYGRYEGRSYDVGTSYVPYDMRANIHKGEIIIDPRSSDILRNYGIAVKGGGSSRETEQLLREQLAEVRQQNRYLYEIVKSGKRNERNTGDVAMAIAHNPSDDVVVVF